MSAPIYHTDHIHWRSQVNNRILTFLFEPLRKELNDVLTPVVEKNNQANNVEQTGFVYRGNIYGLFGVRGSQQVTVYLHHSLVDDFLPLMPRFEEYHKRQEMVRYFLMLANDKIRNPKDYLLYLPECVHEFIRTLFHANHFNGEMPQADPEFFKRSQEYQGVIESQLAYNLLIK